MDFRNKSELTFTDIGSEMYRTYVFESGMTITIKQPQQLHVSKSGGHRVWDINGKSHYIAPGWKHLYWEVHEGKPHFVL